MDKVGTLNADEVRLLNTPAPRPVRIGPSGLVLNVFGLLIAIGLFFCLILPIYLGNCETISN